MADCQDRGVRTQREHLLDLYADDPTLIDDNARVEEITGYPASSVRRAKARISIAAADRAMTIHDYALSMTAEADDGAVPTHDPHPDTGYDTSDTLAIDWEGQRYLFCTKGHDWTASFELVSDLVWWYTSQGEGRSKREVSLLCKERHGQDLTEDFLAHALRRLGITKHVAPFPPHMLQRHTPDELAKLALHRRQAGAESALRRDEARQWRKVAEDAQGKLRDQDRTLSILSRAFAQTPRMEYERISAAVTDRVAICAAYDIHFGKHYREHGLEQTTADFLDAAQRLALMMADMGAPRKAVVVFGGDYFHVAVNAPHKATGGMTVAGTPQDMACSIPEMIRAGTLAAVRYCEILAAVCPVEVHVIDGNHEGPLAYALATSLDLYFAGNDRVNLVWDDRSRRYIRLGSCLVGIEHGDGPKPADLGMLMAHEAPREWGQTQHRFWITGHLHHVHEREVGGVHLLQAPSLAHHDEWHHKKGLVMSKPAHRAYLLDMTHGLVASLST